MMNVARHSNPSCLVFQFSGRLTFRDSGAFESIIADIGGTTLPWVRFDFSGLEYLDSYGIGLIALARDAAETAGAHLELSCPHGAVADVLSRIAFDFFHQGDDSLRISAVHNDGEEARIALAGDFRVRDQDLFLPVIQSAMDGSYRRLVLDLGQLRFIDSIGVSLIMTAADEIRKADKELVLSRPVGAVRELLRLTAIDTVVQVVEAV